MFKRSYQGVFFFLSIVLLATSVFAADNVWQEINDSALSQRPVERPIAPDVYRTFLLNKTALQQILAQAPMEYSSAGRMRQIILSLPMPDGTFGRFRIENSPIMEPALAEKFPEIQTYSGQGIDDPTATVRFDLTPTGFHGMVLTTHGTIYIDPFSKGDTDNYISYHKTDLRNNGKNHICLINQGLQNPFKIGELGLFRDTPSETPITINGTQLRSYRLALAATGEYTAVFGGTVAGAMAAMTTTMNRVNGVYMRDVAVRMVMIANNNLIIYTNGATDPYTNDDGEIMLDENQANIDSVIGNANYDIGHVFSTGGGGIAQLNAPCATGFKAQGVTGLPNPVGDAFDIDFVAHEMGHQFGGNHTFNTSCGGNREPSAAYEPGSGITIMAYAGVCGAQDLALHSIDTFHVKSLEEIIAFKESGGTCGPTTSTGNTPPTVTVVGGPTFNIPKQTPFTLSATGTDVNGDTLTFDWLEYRLGAATSAIPNTDATGSKPTMRPYLPTSGARTFPQLTYILNNSNIPPSTYGGGLLTGELLPQAAATIPFQVVARDNRANGGGINTANATVVVSNDGPFAITSQNSAVTYQGNSAQTVTWNVANTTAAPINAANVKISFSTDGGLTFPTTLNAGTPNDGSQSVIIPAGNTTTGRIKVEAVGNIFFDINGANITVSGLAPAVKSRADFDGDGKTDLSVFRPTEGNWYLNRSTAGVQVLHWGISTDTLVPGDYDNDGKTDTAVFRPSNSAGTPDFYVLNSNGFVATGAEWGLTGDTAVVGDYDGDGKTDIAVYRPSNNVWYILNSGGGITVTAFGQAGDVPVVGDFDGDGKSDLTVNRSGTWVGQLSGGGALNVAFGTTGDILVPADYDNDNKTDIAIYRPSEGNWYIRKSTDSTTSVIHWGIATDIPVPGDYDGDGADDQAIYRAGTWYINRSTSGALVQPFGVGTDKAIPTAYNP
ncbi:MAG: reprolysin-like metallopeptidase [Pyrinomonadaceae bacterium]